MANHCGGGGGRGAACGRRSGDTERACVVRGVGTYKMGQLTNSITGPL